MSDWLHRTKTGRVVYEHKPRLFNSRAVIRVYKGWMVPESQSTENEILEVMWELWYASMLELTRRSTRRWGQLIRDWIRRMLRGSPAGSLTAEDIEAIAQAIKDQEGIA